MGDFRLQCWTVSRLDKRFLRIAFSAISVIERSMGAHLTFRRKRMATLDVKSQLKSALLLMRVLLVNFAVTSVGLIAPVMAQKMELSVDASKTGAKIDRNIFGQFAEHLGHGVYEGIWVGPDSTIPNTRGFRNDVVAALKGIKVPNVRWPGGCYADEYHWRKAVGPQRAITLNSNWGG